MMANLFNMSFLVKFNWVEQISYLERLEGI